MFQLPELQMTPTIFIMIFAIAMDFYAVVFKEEKLPYYSFRGMILSILAAISAFLVYNNLRQIVFITIASGILSSLYISVWVKNHQLIKKLVIN